MSSFRVFVFVIVALLYYKSYQIGAAEIVASYKVKFVIMENCCCFTCLKRDTFNEPSRAPSEK